MRKRCLFIGLCILFFAPRVFSQIKEFDLSRYQLPELERRTLEFAFNLGGNNSGTEQRNDLADDIEDNSSLNYYGNIDARYTYYLNNNRFQKETYAIFYLRSGFDNRKSEGDLVSKNFEFIPSLRVNHISRNYFSGDYFFAINMEGDYNYARNDYYRKLNEYNSESDEHSLYGVIPLKIGKGRIERVNDVRHAIFILNALKEANRLVDTKDDEDVTAFADLIANLKNKRFFDQRIRRMYELEAIDSFLQANYQFTERDARYFATMNDFWLYGGYPTRNAGSRFALAFYPGYKYYSDNYTLEYDRDTTEADITRQSILLAGGMEYVYEKPINLQWQNTITGYGYFGVINTKEKEDDFDEEEINIPHLKLGASQKLGYYPNTRTFMSFQYGAEYLNLMGEDKSDENGSNFNGQGIRTAATVNVEYFISPQLRLDFNASANYFFSKNDMDYLNEYFRDYGVYNYAEIPNYYLTYRKRYDLSFSLRLIYQLF